MYYRKSSQSDDYGGSLPLAKNLLYALANVQPQLSFVEVVAEGEKEVADFNHDDTLPIKSRAAEDEAADVVDELKDSVNFYPRPVDRTSLGD